MTSNRAGADERGLAGKMQRVIRDRLGSGKRSYSGLLPSRREPLMHRFRTVAPRHGSTGMRRKILWAFGWRPALFQSEVAEALTLEPIMLNDAPRPAQAAIRTDLGAIFVSIELSRRTSS